MYTLNSEYRVHNYLDSSMSKICQESLQVFVYYSILSNAEEEAEKFIHPNS